MSVDLQGVEYETNAKLERKMHLHFKKILWSKQGKDLSRVLDTTVGNPEGVDSPFQVESLLRLPKRQTFS